MRGAHTHTHTLSEYHLCIGLIFLCLPEEVGTRGLKITDLASCTFYGPVLSHNHATTTWHDCCMLHAVSLLWFQESLIVFSYNDAHTKVTHISLMQLIRPCIP